MNTKKRNLLIVLGFVLLSGVSGLAAYGFYNNNQSSSNSVKPTSTQTIDPVTKQVIDDGADQTPESYGENPAKPSLIGFAALLDQGITQEDLTAFQGGISNYFISSGNTYPPASVVVFSNASCGLPLDDGTVNCSYNLTVNDKTKINGTFQTDENGHITIGLSKDGKTLYNTSIDENAS